MPGIIGREFKVASSLSTGYENTGSVDFWNSLLKHCEQRLLLIRGQNPKYRLQLACPQRTCLGSDLSSLWRQIQAHGSLVVGILIALNEPHLLQSSDSDTDGRRSQVKPFSGILNPASRVLGQRKQ